MEANAAKIFSAAPLWQSQIYVAVQATILSKLCGKI
jgi:hypothetical protein